MGLYGALQLPYSGPIAALQSQLMIAADLGGEMERLGGNGEPECTHMGFYGTGPNPQCAP